MERKKDKDCLKVKNGAQLEAIRREQAWWKETVAKLEKALSAGEITDSEFERTKQQAAYVSQERLKQYDLHWEQSGNTR